MANIFARIRRPSLRQGLIFGLILGVVQIVLSFVFRFIPDLGTLADAILGILPLALFAVFAYVAGQMASQETGKLSTGVLAGIFTGVIGFVLLGITNFIQAAIFVQQYVNYYTTHPAPGFQPSDYTPSFVLAHIVIAQLQGLLFYALVALVAGGVGGMVGRRRVPVPQAGKKYEEAMFVTPTPDEV